MNKRIRQLKARMQCYGLVAWITIKLIAIGLHGLWKMARGKR